MCNSLNAQKMCSFAASKPKPMSCAALSERKPTSSDFSWRWMRKPAKSLHSTSATVAGQAPKNYGTRFQPRTETGPRSIATPMHLTEVLFPQRSIDRSSKKARKTQNESYRTCQQHSPAARITPGAVNFVLLKNPANHIGAIRYLLCQYNLELARA